MARIDTLTNFITDIAAAIKVKTGKNDPITPANFDSEINSIETGGSVETDEKYTPRYIRFQGYKGDELNYELKNIDFSNLTSFAYMFNSCSNMTSIDLTKYNIPAVESFEYAFYNCYHLTELKFGDVDASKIKSMSYIFRECKELKRIDLSSWTKAKTLSSISYAFYNCLALEYLDIRCIDFDSNPTYTSMLTNVPKTCEIIVADSKSKSFITSKFSGYTNVKTVEELEAEQ